MSTAAKTTTLAFAKWKKALLARKPTPDQTRLLSLWSEIEETLQNFEVQDHSDLIDSEAELLHVTLEDGRVWLTVTEHRTVDVPLDELCSDGKQLALIKEAILQLAQKTDASKTSKKAVGA